MKYPRYLRSVEDLKKAFKKVNLVHSEHGRKMAMKGEVIITSSGMMDGGPVLSYMNKLKNDKNSHQCQYDLLPELHGTPSCCFEHTQPLQGGSFC